MATAGVHVCTSTATRPPHASPSVRVPGVSTRSRATAASGADSGWLQRRTFPFLFPAPENLNLWPRSLPTLHSPPHTPYQISIFARFPSQDAQPRYLEHVYTCLSFTSVLAHRAAIHGLPTPLLFYQHAHLVTRLGHEILILWASYCRHTTFLTPSEWLNQL